MGIFTPLSTTMAFLGKSTPHDNQLVLPQNSKNSEFRAFSLKMREPRSNPAVPN